ncbi:MAG: hypothetical protein LUE61_00005 [Clostridiales bacterium]|nr:hypothetical protein [Clostridiales bacterium]
MKLVVIGICIVIIVVIIALLGYKKMKAKCTEHVSEREDGNLIPKHENTLLQPDRNKDELVIQMEMIPAEAIPDEGKLVEITDSKVLAHVDNLVPGFAQAGVAGNNAIQAAKTEGEVLYRAIIPNGAKLSNSKAMEGAVRGIYHGADGIQGHANFIPDEAQKGTAMAANTAVAAMGVASMVVGQYYMTQINAELREISDGISKISNFQDNEFRSRVFSLIAHVKKIADFQVEILENDELRLSKIVQIDSLEEECTKLLGQVNLTLVGYAKKEELNYEAYEKELKEAQNWYAYQKALLDVLYKISDLRYTLHMGAVSREQCVTLLPTYTKQVEEAQTRLAEWHESTITRLKIDLEEIRRERNGLDRAIHLIPGLFNDDFKFRAISKRTVGMIKDQASGEVNDHPYDITDLYSEDVQLISKDGKVYYLPAE